MSWFLILTGQDKKVNSKKLLVLRARTKVDASNGPPAEEKFILATMTEFLQYGVQRINPPSKNLNCIMKLSQE